MRKFVITAVAAASLLTVASAANAELILTPAGWINVPFVPYVYCPFGGYYDMFGRLWCY
jgi:hypothetical protein